MKVPMSSIEEQEVLADILDNAFGKKIAAQELSEVLMRIDRIKKAMLGRAFRGLL